MPASLGMKLQNQTRPGVRAARPARERFVVCSAQQSSSQQPSSRRALLAGLAAGLALGAVPVLPSKAERAFLESTGARGILAEEESALYSLRLKAEGEAKAALAAERETLEEEVRKTQGNNLCATPFGIDVVGISQTAALIGAIVGGVSARNRKNEVERLNEQLRRINNSLRQQARSGTVYAPGLTYAPVTGAATPAAAAVNSTPMADAASSKRAAAPVASIAMLEPPASPSSNATAASPRSSATILSMDEDELSAEQLQCKEALRAGKRLLKEKSGAAAMVRFERALMLARALRDRTQERRAERGLAASARLQGQYKAAIKHLERVLEISQDMREYTGDADAYGTIADCLADMGEFDKAGEYYDKYIERMNDSGPL